jgi:hypothetical protein
MGRILRELKDIILDTNRPLCIKGCSCRNCDGSRDPNHWCERHDDEDD